MDKNYVRPKLNLTEGISLVSTNVKPDQMKAEVKR